MGIPLQNSFRPSFDQKAGGLKAGILHKGYQGKRILEFTLDDSEEAFKPSCQKQSDIRKPSLQDFNLKKQRKGTKPEKRRRKPGKKMKPDLTEKEVEAQEIDAEIEDL